MVMERHGEKSVNVEMFEQKVYAHLLNSRRQRTAAR